ncbi:MAG: nitroreductase family protein [Bacteroidales bacterium]
MNKDIHNIILRRRSIRTFKAQDLSKEQILRVIKAGMYAPTAFNVRPWEFVVLQDQKDRQSIVDSWPWLAPLLSAPVAVVVCGNMTNVEPGTEWWVQDVSCAMQNMQLQAESDNLGSVWLGFYPDHARCESLASMFNMPSHLKPFAILALGVPAEKFDIPERFEAEKVHWGTF